MRSKQIKPLLLIFPCITALCCLAVLEMMPSLKDCVDDFQAVPEQQAQPHRSIFPKDMDFSMFAISAARAALFLSRAPLLRQ